MDRSSVLLRDRQGDEGAGPEAGGESNPSAGDGELERGEAREEVLKGDGGLDRSELGAEAEMDAGAECEVTARVAAEVKTIRILENTGIAVGGGETAEEHLAAADRLAAELGSSRPPDGRYE
jgi:hypothetical protein